MHQRMAFFMNMDCGNRYCCHHYSRFDNHNCHKYYFDYRNNYY